MWQNYLNIAFRNLLKNKTFSAINIFGLALGMACCFLIVQYVWHESTYDRFHKNINRLYRIAYHINFANEATLARIPPTFTSQFPENFPEIEHAARMFPRDVSVTVPETDKQFEIENVLFSDSTITDVFQFDFIHGNPQTALDQPFSVVLTDETALQLFGTTNVIGKKLNLVEADNFKITGVIKNWPDNAHLRLSMLVPYDNMVDIEPPHARQSMTQVIQTNWMASHSYTYVLLKKNQDIAAINKKFKPYIQKYGHENIKEKQDFSLFPVKDIHLHSTMSLEARPPANLTTLYLFIGIGLVTLLIACFNFINLTTASSLTRAKEVGVRKVLGAGRKLLVGQFLGESMLLSFVAFIISNGLASMAMPFLNGLTGLELEFSLLKNSWLLLTFIGVFIFAGLLAGSYPAFFVSKFQAVDSLKGAPGSTKKPGGSVLRKALITLQFLVTIAFISGALIMFLQLNFLRNQPLGFSKDLVIQVPIDNESNMNSLFRPGDATLRQRMNTLDESLLSNPNIKAVTQCTQTPGTGAIGRPVWNDHVTREDAFTASVNSVDYDYLKTFDLEIIAGRDFDISYGSDHLAKFILNETAVKDLGWESPEAAIGQRLVDRQEGQIIGVVKDYHFQSLYTDITPLILRINPGEFSNFAIKLENANIPQTLAFIEDKWKEFFPGKRFEYTFLDESIDDTYNAEQTLLSVVGYFAFLAILISCFGLFGLAALVTQHRFKEIGIRKILGASIGQLLNTLAKEFIGLIALAMILAVPLTWYFITNWMEDFAFRIPFPWWVPFATGICVILLAFLTVTSQTIRTALANPVEALRHE